MSAPSPSSGPRVRRSDWWRPAVLAVVLLGGFIGLAAAGVTSTHALRELIAGLGTAGVVLFTAAFVLLILLPVPSTIPTIAAGHVFGFTEGAAVTITASMVTAVLAFEIGRLAGRPLAVRLLEGAPREALELFRERSVWAVFLLRTLPISPFWLVNYLAGALPTRRSAYVLGTALGTLPGSVTYSAVGAWGLDPGSWQFLLALTGLVLLTILTLAAARRYVGTATVPGNGRRQVERPL